MYSKKVSEQCGREIAEFEEAASDGAGNTAERLTSHPGLEDDMATSDHTGAHCALEQLIKEQRASLISAHAAQCCLCQVLLYADDEQAVMYAEAAHVVARMMGDVVDKLDSVNLRTNVVGSGS